MKEWKKICTGAVISSRRLHENVLVGRILVRVHVSDVSQCTWPSNFATRERGHVSRSPGGAVTRVSRSRLSMEEMTGDLHIRGDAHVSFSDEHSRRVGRSAHARRRACASATTRSRLMSLVCVHVSDVSQCTWLRKWRSEKMVTPLRLGFFGGSPLEALAPCSATVVRRLPVGGSQCTQQRLVASA